MTQARRLAAICGLVLALLCSLVGRGEAATCNGFVTAMNFGPVSVRSGVSNTTSGQLQVSCSGVLVSAIGVCVTFGPGGGGAAAGNSPRMMRRDDGELLSYELRSGGSGPLFGTLNSVFLTVPVVLGSGSVTLPIYGAITASSVAVGTGSYRSVFSGDGNIRLSYGTLSCAQPGTGVSMPSFEVTADVVPSCELDVSGLDFGNIPAAILSPIAGEGAIRVRCTANTSYSVGLGNGTGIGASGPTQRRMMNLLSGLTYGLYQDAGHGQPWGDTLATSRPGTGVGGNQTMTVYGLIASGQNAILGTYSDSVVVTVTYN
jgi:spore coat protein U-like protein